MKRYAYLLGFLAAISLLTFAYCTGKSQGAVTVEDGQLRAQIKVLEKAGDLLKQKADSLSKRAEAAEKKAETAKIVYRTRVDSIPVLPAPPDLPPQFTLVDTVAMHKAFASADTAIALQDSTIALKDKQIFALKNLVGIRDEEITSLNKRMSLASKRVSNARRQGWLQGASLAALGIILVKASR